MLGWFEKLLYPYPDTAPKPPPARFLAFVWACTQGLRLHLLAMTVLTALIGAFEALLFAVMGHIVDWLGRVPPALLWAQERDTLLLLAAVILASPLLIALQTLIKHQSLAGKHGFYLRQSPRRVCHSA